MSYTPIYRGTSKNLNATAVIARDWMLSICREIVNGWADDEIMAEAHLMLDAAQSSDQFRVAGFSQQVRREGSGYVWSTGESSNYQYVWEIGKSWKTSWSAQRIVLRKDGTVHMENLENALHSWASAKVRNVRQDNTHAANLEEYEQLQSPGKHDSYVTVELSKGKLGMCSITYSNTWVKLGKVHDVPIQNAQRMIDKMMSVAENFAADAVEIRDDI